LKAKFPPVILINCFASGNIQSGAEGKWLRRLILFWSPGAAHKWMKRKKEASGLMPKLPCNRSAATKQRLA